MAVPKKRTSKSRKNMRRAHDAIAFTAAVMVCPHCGENKLMHHVCNSCGYYRGRMMFDSAVSAGGTAAVTVSTDVVSVSDEETEVSPSADE